LDAKSPATPTGEPIPGLYAAGEIAGGLFFHNYASGTGLMSGAVFGRLAGRNAAHMCRLEDASGRITYAEWPVSAAEV
jgi:tricarballylate dehydrogenase